MQCTLQDEPRAVGGRIAARSHLDAAAPPMFVIQGTHDSLVWVEEARIFVSALQAVANRAGGLRGAARGAARLRDISLGAHRPYRQCCGPFPRMEPRPVAAAASACRRLSPTGFYSCPGPALPGHEPMSPQRACRIAIAASGAVSVRNTRGPSCSELKPACTAASDFRLAQAALGTDQQGRARG